MTEQEFLDWAREEGDSILGLAESAVLEIDDVDSTTYIAAQKLLAAHDDFYDLVEPG